MSTLPRRFPLLTASLILLFTVQCGGRAAPAPTAPTPTVVPAPPTTPAVTVTSMQVGVAGNRPGALPPGQSLQLWALANYSDGTTADVTNTALWQSSNPVVATVSPSGLLTAAAAGLVDATATVQQQSGVVHIEVRPLGCQDSSLSPASLTFSVFGGSYNAVNVSTPLSDCRWTVRSDASWLPFPSESQPRRSGSGSFSYDVPSNNFPDARTAHLLVTFSNGYQLIHTVTQEQPSCSYVVRPAAKSFSSDGGSAFFDVTATPSTCRWIISSFSELIAGATITGDRVSYRVSANPYHFTRTGSIEVKGLSGTNPSASHAFQVAGR